MAWPAGGACCRAAPAHATRVPRQAQSLWHLKLRLGSQGGSGNAEIWSAPPMGGASPPLFASPPPSLPLQQDCPVCWICLDSTGTLMFPCKCPRCAAAPPAPAPCCACTLLPVAVLLCSWSCKRKHYPSHPPPCMSPVCRMAHSRCLARWQLQKAGSRCASAALPAMRCSQWHSPAACPGCTMGSASEPAATTILRGHWQGCS